MTMTESINDLPLDIVVAEVG